MSQTKVLIVEDELLVASSIAENLERAGYLVAGMASSAIEALAIAENSSPDLVLMDIRIKGPVDGVRTAEQIRDRFRIPVIFLTAHSDGKTLDRAKLAEPFGYMLKPVSQASLLTGIEVALYKHSIDQKLEEHRAWLETILQTTAEAVIVTDIEGRIQFLNSAAENLTELKQARVRGRILDDVLVLRCTGTDVSPQSLLARAVKRGTTVAIPRNSTIRRSDGELSISGHFAVSKNDIGHPMGGVITIHDVTAEKLEEQQIRQEQKMSLVGHFAGGVAEDFNGLLDLISACTQNVKKRLGEVPELAEDGELGQDLVGIQQSTDIALTMSRLLLNLANNSERRPELVDMDALARDTQPLLRQLAGPRIDLSVSCASGIGSVFCDKNQMEQLLMNLVLNAKERLAERGKIRLIYDDVLTDRPFVRIRVTADQSSDADLAWAALTFPFQMDSPPLSLSLAGAIIAAAEGYLSSRTIGETSNEVEILLPRRDRRGEIDVLPSHRSAKSVLLVGLASELADSLHREMQRLAYSVFQAQSVKEALLILGIYGNEISAIVADGSATTSRNRKALNARISSQKVPPALLQLAFSSAGTLDGWQTLVKPLPPRAIIDVIEVATRNPESKGLAAKAQ